MFTITTNNSSAHFNTSILKDTSNIIYSILLKDPNISQYHIGIDDNENVLGKFEKLYQGKQVVFTEEELPISKKITNTLKIRGCPNYMKPESLKTQEDEKSYRIGLQSGVIIDELNFFCFIKNDKYRMNESFTIITNKNQYKCNYFTVFISQVIRETFLNDPSKREYKYDFNDENNEFQLICNIFNLKSINITPSNMYSLKEMADDLKIDLILPFIEKNIKENEKISETIDELQEATELNEKLFDWLYNIDKLTVKTVKTLIVDSIWSKTEDNVNELTFFIIQVINSSIKLHPYLIDLIFQLEKEANETNKLDVFMSLFKSNIQYSIGKNKENCAFIYKLCKKGIFDEKEIINNIYQSNFENIIWFLPEFIEHKKFDIKSFEENPNVFRYKDGNSVKKMRTELSEFINFYKDKIDLYKQMRDNNQHDDILTKSIYEDDVDKLQSILSKSTEIDFSEYKLPYNIFDIDNGQTTLINYAAANGSIKCFKYLLLNHSNIDGLTFSYAVYGGNIEIIKIVEQNSAVDINIIKAIDFAIIQHRNDLFDYIFEQKLNGNESTFLLNESIINGNAHSLIELIDRSASSLNFQELIELAASNGFYRITKLIYNIMSKRSSEFSIDKIARYRLNTTYFKLSFNDKFVIVGNLSIFKIAVQLLQNKDDLDGMLVYSIDKDYKRIFDYYFDVLFKKDFTLSNNLVYLCLKQSMTKESNYYFNRLNAEIKNIDPYFFYQYSSIQNTVNLSCQSKNVEYFKEIYNIANEYKLSYIKEKAFLEAAKSGSIEICQYFFDNKIKINFSKIESDIANDGSINKDIFLLILNNVNDVIKNKLLSWSLYPSIKRKNKDLIDYLLNENVVQNDKALIEDVFTNDIDTVETVLKYKNDPSFVNKKSKDGTALFIAINQNNLEIVQRLLKIPGIDPGLYDKEDQTPLICSIVNFNLEIMNEILDFYGDNIQSQTWQLEKAIQIALKILSPGNNKLQTIRRMNEDTLNHERKSQLLLILKRILEIKNIDPNCHSGEFTLLSYACEANEIGIVQMLLKTEKVDVNAYAPLNGNTPLMISILKKNVEITELLINDKRTDINAVNYENETALIIAVKNNLGEIVDLLIKNERFDPEQSQINYALFISNAEISKILLFNDFIDVNYKYSNIDSKDLNEYETPLNNAVNKMDFEKINLLIQHPSFDKKKSLLYKSIFDTIITSKDRVINEKIEIFKLLIKINDNDPNIFDDDNSSLLMCAAIYFNSSFISIILENENFDSKKSNLVDVFNYLISKNDDIYDLIFQYDINHDHLIDLNKLLPNGDSYFTNSIFFKNKRIDFLLENGVDPNILDKNEIYPLEFAIYCGSTEAISSLLKSKKIDLSKQIKLKNKNFINAILNSKGFSKWHSSDAIMNPKSKIVSFIHLAAFCHSTILDLFLKNKKIDINAKDDQGETPLIIACRNNQKDNIGILFECKNQELDYMHKNNDGDDALKIVQSNENPGNKNEYKNALISAIRSKSGYKKLWNPKK